MSSHKRVAQAAEIPVSFTTCPKCDLPVTYRWEDGFIPEPHNVLVADWVYHSECWDALVAQSPPTQAAGDGDST